MRLSLGQTDGEGTYEHGAGTHQQGAGTEALPPSAERAIYP